MNIRKGIYKLIDENNEAELKINEFIGLFIIFLIVLNVIGIIAESFAEFELVYRNELYYFELLSVVVFTSEYLMRIITADFRRPDLSYGKAVWNYISSPMALVDLFAILPFYLPYLIKFDMRSIRALRLLRLLRLFKLGRYSSSIRMMSEVVRDKAAELGVALFVTGILLTIASVLMFYLEHEYQPEAFPNILATFWWAIATLTTVGYGDVYPITGWGKLVSGVIAILGIGMVALPTGIISSAFVDKMDEQRREEKAKTFVGYKYCPHCGEKLEGQDDE